MKSVDGCAHGSGRRFGVGRGAEHILAAQPDHFRDAAIAPVVDSLETALLHVVTEHVGNFGGAAQALDELGIRMFGSVHAGSEHYV